MNSLHSVRSLGSLALGSKQETNDRFCKALSSEEKNHFSYTGNILLMDSAKGKEGKGKIIPAQT